MTVKIVREEFSVYDYPELSFYELGMGMNLNLDDPKLKVNFYTDHTCFSETMDGEYQFSRKYRKQFKELRINFCRKYEEWFSSKDNLPVGFEPLEFINNVVKDLEETIQNNFVIPGKIELNNIGVSGDWVVFETQRESEMVKEFDEEVERRLKDKLNRVFKG